MHGLRRLHQCLCHEPEFDRRIFTRGQHVSGLSEVRRFKGRKIYGIRDPSGLLRYAELVEGQTYRNEPGTVHQMEAITDCDVLEASTPHLDDVVRLSDRYGREGTSAP